MKVVGSVDGGGDLVIGSKAVHMSDHVWRHGDCREMVCTDDSPVVNGIEAARAGTVGNLCDTDGCDCTRGHAMGALATRDMIHRTEGEVAIPTSIRGPIVYNLEGAEPVCPRKGREHVQAECDERDEESEQCSRASVWEAGMNASDSLLNVPALSTTCTCMPGPE